MSIQEIAGGINSPKGFQAAGVLAGIKPGRTKPDMALVASRVPCAAAGVFTRNLVKAAPVLWDTECIEQGGTAQAVVINTGIANACTGSKGYADTVEMAALTAKELGIRREQVLVLSTGVIGKPLPMESIRRGIQELGRSLSRDPEAAHTAAEGILTTDTHAKEIALEFTIQGKPIRIAGMCKGSGMIHPNMGTMLGIITTDMMITRELMQESLKELTEETFNMVSVDGDTSTNDSLLLLANGQAENTLVSKRDSDFECFYEALKTVMTFLAKSIAADGEGATRLLEATVLRAGTKEDAKRLAKSIITSNLTKAAVFGTDANWGRILCAMGYSGAFFRPEQVEIRISSEKGSLVLVENGTATDYDEELATAILSPDKVTITADVQEGTETATAWGCDLTYEYVKINADYRS